jgi:hypothetical protein
MTASALTHPQVIVPQRPPARKAAEVGSLTED